MPWVRVCPIPVDAFDNRVRAVLGRMTAISLFERSMLARQARQLAVSSGIKRPIADVTFRCHDRGMNTERFIAGQRKGVNFILTAFVILTSVMWGATVCDWAFHLGWGWDRQILWLAPPMMLFGVVLRFLCMAIFRFVGGDPSGS